MTVEEFVKLAEIDAELQKEVAELLAQGKNAFGDFRTLAHKYGAQIGVLDMLKYVDDAKKLGFVK